MKFREPRLPWRLAAIVLAAAASWVVPEAAAQPPLPEFATRYGTILDAGANLDPPSQPIVAIVNGRVCGSDRTFIAPPGPNVPPEDVGRTVYRIDVYAKGDGPGHHPDCAVVGDTIRFYLPESGRFANETSTFAPGAERLDLTVGDPLPYRGLAPRVARDGTD